jgi:phosphoribosylanthranilate isomerase
VRENCDLVELVARYPKAQAILLDAVVQGYGGGGKVFDWSLIPEGIGRQAVLSGGLNAQNVADAIARVQPYAVDVSSGVEISKGIKDAQKMRAFIDAVRRADSNLIRSSNNESIP